jgi:hypothetical protein
MLALQFTAELKVFVVLRKKALYVLRVWGALPTAPRATVTMITWADLFVSCLYPPGRTLTADE